MAFGLKRNLGRFLEKHLYASIVEWAKEQVRQGTPHEKTFFQLDSWFLYIFFWCEISLSY